MDDTRPGYHSSIKGSISGSTAKASLVNLSKQSLPQYQVGGIGGLTKTLPVDTSLVDCAQCARSDGCSYDLSHIDYKSGSSVDAGSLQLPDCASCTLKPDPTIQHEPQTEPIPAAEIGGINGQQKTSPGLVPGAVGGLNPPPLQCPFYPGWLMLSLTAGQGDLPLDLDRVPPCNIRRIKMLRKKRRKQF